MRFTRRSRLLWMLLLVFVAVLQMPSIVKAFTINYLSLNVPSGLSRAGRTRGVEIPVLASSFSARRLVLLALASRARGELGAAVYDLEQAVQSPYARDVWWFQLADLYFRTGQLGKSQAALDQIENVESLVLVYCKEAITSNVNLERAKQWCPIIAYSGQSSAEGTCLLGQYYIVTDQLDEASLTFKRAAIRSDVSDDCLYQYGRFMQRQQKYEESLSLYSKAFAKRQLPLYLRAMAGIYSSTGRLDEAMIACQRAYDLSLSTRDRADSLACKGTINFWYYEDYEQASRLFKAAINLDKRVDVSIYLKLARSERWLERPQDAIRNYQVVTDRLGGSTYLLGWRHEYAAYLVELGMEAAARQVYLDILQDAPDDPVAKNALGQE